jgi:hypothetical protein
VSRSLASTCGPAPTAIYQQERKQNGPPTAKPCAAARRMFDLGGHLTRERERPSRPYQRLGARSPRRGSGPLQPGAAAGNEVGITSARQGAPQLYSAHSCAGSPAETWEWPGSGDWDAWLGVKGSPVQIRPSRRFFERWHVQLGTKFAQLGTIMAGRPGMGQAEHQRMAADEAELVTARPSLTANDS